MARREYFRVPKRSRIIWFASANVVTTVDVAGSITWTGATDVVLVATTSIPKVNRRRRRKPKRIVRGSRIARFTPLANVISNVDVQGQLLWTGQSVALVLNVAPTAGAITWQGSSITLAFGVTPTPGQITWNGATDILLVATTSIPRFNRRRRRKPKKIVRGSRIQRFTAVVPGVTNVDVAGQITWTGQDLPLRFTIPITAGQVTWSGQSVALVLGTTPTAGSITWAGQALPLSTKIGVTAGAILWAGATDIVLIATGGPPPGTPVECPDADLIGAEAEALLSQVFGAALLSGTEGNSVLTSTNGDAVLVGTEGQATTREC
jgi:hypothetical protein